VTVTDACVTCGAMWKDVWGVKDKVEKVAVKVAVKVKM
jgi:hypothetical protein